MSELQPTRENDARIAEAMGWTVKLHDEVPDCPPFYLARPPWPPRQEQQLPYFLTDRALIQTMIERIGQLAHCRVTLHHNPRSTKDRYVCEISGGHQAGTFGASTPNLALGSALLMAWTGVKR